MIYNYYFMWTNWMVTFSSGVATVYLCWLTSWRQCCRWQWYKLNSPSENYPIQHVANIDVLGSLLFGVDPLVYTSCMTTFSAECLHRLRPSSDTRLDNAAWKAACHAGVTLHRPTHRGCLAGAPKRRNIPVITTSRLATLTKPRVTSRGNNNIQVPCGK